MSDTIQVEVLSPSKVSMMQCDTYQLPANVRRIVIDRTTGDFRFWGFVGEPPNERQVGAELISSEPCVLIG